MGAKWAIHLGLVLLGVLGTAPAAVQPPQSVTLTIHDHTLEGRSGPYYSPARWALPEGNTVRLTIISHDDGTAPLRAGSPKARVSGTQGNLEWVDGKPVHGFSVTKVAHTLTIPALRINLPIPAAPPHGAVVVTAWVRADKSGTFLWYCGAPCGSGPSGLGGPMAMRGYMRGTVMVSS